MPSTACRSMTAACPPCVSGGPIPCPQCNTPGTGQLDTLSAAVYLHRAIRKLKDHPNTVKLWQAKKLVDEVINEDRHAHE